MMKPRYIKLFLFAVILTCLPVCRLNAGDDKQPASIVKDYEQDNIRVKLTVEPLELNMAGTVDLKLEVTWDEKHKITMPDLKYFSDDFDLLDVVSKPDIVGPDKSTTRRRLYRLAPMNTGDIEIPSVGIEYWLVGAAEKEVFKVRTDPVSITVHSKLTARDADISDIKGQVRPPFNYRPILLLAGGFAGCLLVVVLAYTLIRMRKPKVKVVYIYKTAHEIAFAELEQLIAERLIDAGQVDIFYDRISDILRHYIEHRFNISAPDRTTEEFLVEIQNADQLSFEDRSVLGSFLEHCDLVKFARFQPAPGQIDKTIEITRDFITRTASEDARIKVGEV